MKVVSTTLLTLVLLGGCGSGSDTPAALKPTASDTAATTNTTASASKSAGSGRTAGATPTASKSAEATYFTLKDTDAINKVAARVQSAAAKATAASSLTACNKITDYPGWRKCWHALLDPYSKGLTDLAAVLTSLQGGGFPAACKAELADSAQTYTSFATKVQPLLAGIDSNERSKQAGALKRYSPTLDRIAADFDKPFQNLTQVCYSAEDLARIKASPTPSP